MSAEGAFRDGDGAGFDLIETMRWEPGNGFVRLERHLARLSQSAHYLGFAHDPSEINAALASVRGDTALRARLLLDRKGEVSLTHQIFHPLSSGTIWRLRIARTRLDSADPLLRHKTTRRHLYQRARAEFSATDADEVLLLNERGEVCEGTVTSLFMDRGDGGPLLTPSLQCGLLAGVLRDEMLAKGAAREAVLRPDDLALATAIYVGNSLRERIRVVIG